MSKILLDPYNNLRLFQPPSSVDACYAHFSANYIHSLDHVL